MAYYSTVKHLADTGIKLIVDEVMDGKLKQKVWQGVFVDTEVIFVGVMCAPYKLIAREKLRNDRINGFAIEQAGRVLK